MSQPNPVRTRHSVPSHRKEERREPQAPAAKRILLVSRDTRLLERLSRRLGTWGHRVWTISSEEDRPTHWSPRLYDILVFSAEDTSSVLNELWEAAKKADSRLFRVMLAREPFAAAIGVPDAVITEREGPAIAEKLLAVVNGSADEAA